MIRPKALLIIHPRARRSPHFEKLVARLDQDYTLMTHESSYAGQTRELVVTHLNDEVDLIVTAGGDGTLHEALNGWADLGFPSGPRFLPLPLGSGNDFLLSLDRRLHAPESFLKHPLTWHRDADLGRVTCAADKGSISRYFCVGATTGFSALVTERRARLANTVPGALSYLLALFLSFAFWRNRRVRLESQEAALESETFLNFNAANVRHYGGGMVSSPHADPFDGALNGVSMNLSIFQALRALPENFRGNFDRISNVDQLLFQKPFRVDCIPSAPVQSDGEMLGCTPMEIECHPGKLPLLLPQLEERR